MQYKVYTDGAARGNPGPAGAGYIIYDKDGHVIHKAAIPLGHSTNNVAEYTALLEAAKYIKRLEPAQVDFMLDSELVVKQVAGIYKAKAPHLKPLLEEVLLLLSSMNATCKHVPREQNKEADKLANIGADQVEKKANT